MEKITTLLCFLFLFSINETINSQNILGTYQIETHATNGKLKRTLILNTDGSFEFHNYEFHEGGLPQEKNNYARGTWTLHKKLIYFTTLQKDLNDKYTLDFSASKARFISKSPRDKSNRDIKTALHFYQSEIFWIKGMKLEKIIN
ncbi:MAG: hypothetical protein ACPG6B_00705 [Oceanihabitans sp.]